ncbi:MAG: DUF4830 domain-containing protein [Clostridia bacterium]|nr:DUF4830 domain-containing protein [Clostridia bacterium]
MFIYSLRAGTLKFFGIIGVALIALVTLIAFVPDDRPELSSAAVTETASYHYDKVKTAEDRVKFLAQFGWEVKPEALEEVEVTIPDEFDKVFAGYNEIQKNQGLDLGRYKNKTVMRYTYEITNYPDYDGRVLVNVLVYRNKVIGGDVCTADVHGFIHGFEKP